MSQLNTYSPASLSGLEKLHSGFQSNFLPHFFPVLQLVSSTSTRFYAQCEGVWYGRVELPGEAQSYRMLLFRFVLSELPALFVDQWSAAAKCDMESGQLHKCWCYHGIVCIAIKRSSFFSSSHSGSKYSPEGKLLRTGVAKQCLLQAWRMCTSGLLAPYSVF